MCIVINSRIAYEAKPRTEIYEVSNLNKLSGV